MSSYPRRPSRREIDKYLKEAHDALHNKRALFCNPAKVVGELMKLGIGDSYEVWQLILQLLHEIQLEDYAGGHPPQKSYEPTIAHCELWAFAWQSKLLGKQMYLKFAIKDKTFYYISLHESRN